MKVFVAGAAGAIGKRLVPKLVERGHEVAATSCQPGKLDELRALGARPVVMDGLDPAAISEAVGQAEPDAIVHQMTALSGTADLRRFDRWFATTNALRTKGTEYLLEAARAAGVKRFIAQSYTGWSNERTGGPVKSEADPLDPEPAKAQRNTLAAIRFLDRVVPEAPLVGIVLRYGNFYGPGTSDLLLEAVRKRQLPVIGGGTGIWPFIEITDAAAATFAAVEHGAPGVYNVADSDPAPVAEWLPYLAGVLGAKPPLRLPAWLGRLLAGEFVVTQMTRARGLSNEKARKEPGLVRSWL